MKSNTFHEFPFICFPSLFPWQSRFRDLQQLLMDLEARLATAAGATWPQRRQNWGLSLSLDIAWFHYDVLHCFAICILVWKLVFFFEGIVDDFQDVYNIWIHLEHVFRFDNLKKWYKAMSKTVVPTGCWVFATCFFYDIALNRALKEHAKRFPSCCSYFKLSALTRTDPIIMSKHVERVSNVFPSKLWMLFVGPDSSKWLGQFAGFKYVSCRAQCGERYEHWCAYPHCY